ncbi:LysR family transcriptional regulator [Saccharopolyspora spinosa]|uniref:DNA-binding transcriptional LysR family regulator n=1 Tax=Saccharopolyspora spinosa TaxID=60894 RepID=A0A2N3XW01_SACSN|nr:LysR family transcriptional regulator [Saccharopolyspora spinosa]PKW14854.1 DNA-binding transcriptional LysR family regulator [Saccharopolyspora spinosa]
MSINIAPLRAFLAVADEGGFSAAADALRISQSAVSHAVAALEKSLDCRVLVRQGKPRPTAFGETILEHARTAVAATDTIRVLAEQRDGRPTGPLRLAAPPTVCQGLLPELLARWRDEFPQLKIRVFEGEDDEVADWLASATVELAVLVDPPPGDGVPIGEDRFHALLPRDHPLADQQEVDLRDLDDDPFLLSCGGCERHVRDAYRQAGARLEPAHRIRELGTLFVMVRAGVGISVVPGLAEPMLDARLVLVPLRQRVTRNLVLTGPLARPWHPAASALVEALRR